MSKSSYTYLISHFGGYIEPLGFEVAKKRLIEHINNPENPSLTTAEGDCLLKEVSNCGDIELVEIILNESHSKEGLQKAYLEAFFYNRIELVKFYIDKFNFLVNDCGLTVTSLMVAVDSGNSEIVDYLIKHGANVNMIDPHGRTSLHYALTALESIVILDHKTNRGTKEAYSEENLIKSMNICATIDLLIKNGADLQAGIEVRGKFFRDKKYFELSEVKMQEILNNYLKQTGNFAPKVVNIESKGSKHLSFIEEELALRLGSTLSDEDYKSFMEYEPEVQETKDETKAASSSSFASAISSSRSSSSSSPGRSI